MKRLHISRSILSFVVLSVALVAPAAGAAEVPAQERLISTNNVPSDSKYVIYPGDVVAMEVYREPDLAASSRVEKDGSAMFPLVGSVDVAGMTLENAAEKVKTEYAKRFLVDPRVTLTISAYAKREFTLLGQVRTPNVYEIPLSREMTLLEAIGMGGGYTRIAQPKNVTIKREVDGETKMFRVDAREMANQARSKQFRILPGDVITVGESIF